MKRYDLKIKKAVFFLLLGVLSLFSLSASTNNFVPPADADFMPPPNIPSFSYPGIHCQTGSALPSLINPNVGPGIAAFYSSPNSNLIINPSTGSINLGATPVGIYQVTYTEQGVGSCSCTVSTIIQVGAIPNVLIAGSSTVCQGSNLALTGVGAIAYSWSTGFAGNPLNFTPIVNTVITVIGTAANGCSNAKSIAITVKPVPIITVPQVSVCSGKSTTLIAYANVPGSVGYTWTPSAPNSSAIVVSPPITALYSVVGKVDGCLSPSTSQIVLVSPSYTPVSGFYYPIPLCVNSGDPRPSFDSLFALGGVFSTDDPDIKVNASTGQINFANVLPGVHTVNYLLAGSGCTVSVANSANVVVNEGGNLISTPNVSILEKTSIALNVSGGTVYNWTPSEYLSCADCENPVATPFETTTFCVTDLENGCITPACTKVEVLCFSERDFSVPNAFTPNGDKNNDEFCLQGWDYCVSNFKVIIYNRWGEKVFESTNPSFCWDGMYKDGLLNSGVYIYAITASVNRENITKKGNITLIR
jgi:gliding motility-associated-like protein